MLEFHPLLILDKYRNFQLQYRAESPIQKAEQTLILWVSAYIVMVRMCSMMVKLQVPYMANILGEFLWYLVTSSGHEYVRTFVKSSFLPI